MKVTIEGNAGFRPLIRGFFFYLNRPVINNEDLNGFPSPHSGILFLSAGVL